MNRDMLIREIKRVMYAIYPDMSILTHADTYELRAILTRGSNIAELYNLLGSTKDTDAINCSNIHRINMTLALLYCTGGGTYIYRNKKYLSDIMFICLYVEGLYDQNEVIINRQRRVTIIVDVWK